MMPAHRWIEVDNAQAIDRCACGAARRFIAMVPRGHWRSGPLYRFWTQACGWGWGMPDCTRTPGQKLQGAPPAKVRHRWPKSDASTKPRAAGPLDALLGLGAPESTVTCSNGCGVERKRDRRSWVYKGPKDGYFHVWVPACGAPSTEPPAPIAALLPPVDTYVHKLL
jgi:hypothetical protein